MNSYTSSDTIEKINKNISFKIKILRTKIMNNDNKTKNQRLKPTEIDNRREIFIGFVFLFTKY